MKLVTVNPEKSTTMGGVETLIRSLHGLFECENYELFEHCPNIEHYAEIEYVSYQCFGQGSKLKTKSSQVKYLKNLALTAQDVVVLFHPNDLLYLPRKVRKYSKVVLVQTNKFEVFFKPFSKLVVSLFHQYVDVFTVYTEQDKKALLALFPQFHTKVQVIPRGCKIDTATTQLMLSKKLVTVARIDEEQKNFAAMVELLAALPEGYSLDIYGDGSENELAALNKLIANNSKVAFKGPTSDVASVLRNCGVFIMTSHYEGFGQTLIEARSQGLPIVAFNTFDALPWIVGEGENGYKVQPGDIDQFADRVLKICEDNALYEQFSRKALEKAKQTEASVVNQLWQEALA
ncbi:glycosyltransferase [Vibrio sp. 404]|uniref:Glycosyltransferase n=1 Tax=Vibrio marinisediminis TaxID=2758441 RepID=A0A7W2FT33_9VIBR|nr:glycosyltransferase [Vibrio marinisediminis]MBA5763773.1 glycosyltransferase [Vibrio marinisediminis]